MCLRLLVSLAGLLLPSSAGRISPGTIDAVSVFASNEAKALSKVDLAKPNYGWDTVRKIVVSYGDLINTTSEAVEARDDGTDQTPLHITPGDCADMANATQQFRNANSHFCRAFRAATCEFAEETKDRRRVQDGLHDLSIAVAGLCTRVKRDNFFNLCRPIDDRAVDKAMSSARIEANALSVLFDNDMPCPEDDELRR
ncbi:MAG: hypothetical protein M1817_000169 [Caeruleum heppii]|nr:MAG: hypothetical protein M1817_000169 [Caeruleum heppii]